MRLVNVKCFHHICLLTNLEILPSGSSGDGNCCNKFEIINRDDESCLSMKAYIVAIPVSTSAIDSTIKDASAQRHFKQVTQVTFQGQRLLIPALEVATTVSRIRYSSAVLLSNANLKAKWMKLSERKFTLIKSHVSDCCVINCWRYCSISTINSEGAHTNTAVSIKKLALLTVAVES